MDAPEASTGTNLEDLIQKAGSPVKLLRGNRMGPYVFPGIPPEFTNWRDEQRAWKESVALLELSYHMTELHLHGSEVIPFLSQFAANKLDPFQVKRAKQIVLPDHDGYHIADGIVFHEEEEFFRVVGAPIVCDWLQFNSEGTSLDVDAAVHHNWMVHQGPREVFRIQIQGPNALPLLREVTNDKLPEIKFFYIGEFQIAGKTVRALRHGMAGTPGFEIYGAWNDQDAVREALIQTGEKYGLRLVGENAYGPTAQESGWIPVPVPAIYHSENMKPYREWLTGYHLESTGSLGGSYQSEDIRDYYVDPIELGYAAHIDFNGDFVGRDALLEKSKDQRRKKVTLVWNEDDVLAVQRAALFGDKPARYINTPHTTYATFVADQVLKGDVHTGLSMQGSYSANARSYISNAVVGIEHSEPGTEVTLLWGEPNSTRPIVEQHEVREIRATVAPAPFFEKVIKTGKQ
ncbi:hypothetical protein [Nocardia sp. R7R-8]|uniref:hypothetical protein n=1 Tax=Nocardia sp. R7R-8 TaxID=3459304 RepID=UPI00403D6778